ncbi:MULTISPECIES: Hpt domain-containing protein [unclassified Pseudodesulfovibrio]|uniref:Hpt domain-containing protein n=1 Tax=unclassified Pseudodesulfovibrio TaxID=2661612 RepID=UPI0013E318B6|nr:MULTISPECIES: Hpt domain-containing protein [unclassified Pseudodesulfovibrio]MCJ2165453.1 Hpt domain-containing protein [Pseudodesulfovibrio sp. S3-i]
MSEPQDYLPGPSDEPDSVLPSGFDLDAACKAMELSREEMLLFLPEAATEIRIRIDAARKALLASALGAVTLNSHTIKSVAASLGVESVRLAAEVLEKNALEGNGQACAALLDSLERRVAGLLVELDSP